MNKKESCWEETTEKMHWLLKPARVKLLKDIRLADVPRGLEPEDIALDCKEK